MIYIDSYIEYGLCSIGKSYLDNLSYRLLSGYKESDRSPK